MRDVTVEPTRRGPGRTLAFRLTKEPRSPGREPIDILAVEPRRPGADEAGVKEPADPFIRRRAAAVKGELGELPRHGELEPTDPVQGGDVSIRDPKDGRTRPTLGAADAERPHRF